MHLYKLIIYLSKFSKCICPNKTIVCREHICLAAASKMVASLVTYPCQVFIIVISYLQLPGFYSNIPPTLQSQHKLTLKSVTDTETEKTMILMAPEVNWKSIGCPIDHNQVNGPGFANKNKNKN